MVLTAGAIQAILNGAILERPILKIVNMKKISADGQPDKIRLILTDGVTNHSYVMLSTQLNSRVASGEIVQDCIIRLDNYLAKKQKDKPIIMVIDLTVLSAQDMENIDPVGVVMRQKNDKPSIISKSDNSKPPSSSNFQTIDIALLNPYQNKWSIKGCVFHKESIKTWSNPKGEGKLFSFTLIDETCDVRITAFNQDVDKFFDLIEVGKTYVVSKATVKPNNRQFNKTKCDHEITLRSDSEIIEVTGDENKPHLSYDFVTISQLKDKHANDTVDIIGVVHEMKELTSVISRKTNKEIIKRDVTIVDRSGGSVEMTLWLNNVKCVENLTNPVIVVRGATVSDFSGRSLSVGFSGYVLVNPTDVPEVEKLIGWYKGGGCHESFVSQSSGGGNGYGARATKKVTISELACTNQGDKGDYFIIEGAIANIKKENIVYKACGKCNKKVVDQNNGLYSCIKCETESPEFKYRLMLNVNVLDHTGGVWMTAFQEMAEKLLGASAQVVGDMLENQEQMETVEKLIGAVLYRDDVKIKVRVTNDVYNDEARMKTVLIDWNLVDTNEALTEILAELCA